MSASTTPSTPAGAGPGNGKPKVENDNIWGEIASIAESTHMPPLPQSLEPDSQNPEIDTLYFVHQTLALANLERILELFKRIGKSQCAMRKHVIPLFLLLGEHADVGASVPWSSPQHETIVSEIISEFYRIFDMEIQGGDQGGLLSPFFIRDFESMGSPIKTTFAHLLKSFRGTLGAKNEVWKLYPAAKHSYYWLLMQVKYPYLSDHIEGTILPALNFFDDFNPENKLFGLNCISHVLDNVVKSTLKSTGWGKLLHKHFMDSIVFQKDANIIDKMLPEILKILKIIEVDPSTYPDQFTKYDDTLEKLLDTFELFEESNAKNIWLKHLTTFLDVMGHGTLHWIDRILRILLDNTHCADPARWLNILKCCKVCIVSTWTKPQSSVFCEIILRIIYNVVELNMSPSSGKTEGEAVSEIFEMTLSCLDLIQCNSDYEEVRSELENFHLDGQGKLPAKFLHAWSSLLTLSHQTRVNLNN